MKQGKIFYLLNEEGRKNSIINGGNGKKIQELLVNIDNENIKYFNVDDDGNCNLEVGFRHNSDNEISKIVVGREITISYNEEPIVNTRRDIITFSKPMDSSSLINYYKDFKKKLDDQELDIKKEYKVRYNIYKNKQEEKENKAKEEQEKRRKRLKELEEQSKEKNRLAEIEKEKWINANGSQELKDAFNNGYNCQRKYVKERAKSEFPDFILDFDENYSYKDRSCPSNKALYESLDINEKYGKDYSKVFWITNDGKEKDYCDKEYEETEGIIIEYFLGKYTLIKEIR